MSVLITYTNNNCATYIHIFAEVDKSCLGLGTNGTCMFYNCFDERWPCPETDNYAIEYGLEICERFDKYYDDFSTEVKYKIM